MTSVRRLLKSSGFAAEETGIFSKIIDIYRKSSFLIRAYIWVRYKTCPFLDIERFIPREGLIIDYGCGHGVFSHILSILSCKREIYGFDISKTRIEEAKKTISIDRKISFSSDKNKIEDIIKISDCIVMLDVICYFPNQEREEILKSFYKNLKEGSILIIKDVQKKLSIKYFWNYIQEIIAVKIIKITEADSLNFFNCEYMHNLIKDVGFKVKVVDISKNYLYPHILYLCTK